MVTKFSKEIADAIKAFLVDDDWKFFYDEENGVFCFGLRINGKLKNAQFLIYVHNTHYIVYAFSPVHADNDNDEQMAKLAEFLTRANYGLRNGSFEMDYEDGEIRYKSFMDCHSLPLSQQTIKDSIYCPAQMLERYGGGILDIIFGDANAKAAAEKCEKTFHGMDMAELFEDLDTDLPPTPPADVAARIAALLKRRLAEVAEKHTDSSDDSDTSDEDSIDTTDDESDDEQIKVALFAQEDDE